MYFKEEELLRQKCFESLIHEYINKQHEDIKNKLIQKNNNRFGEDELEQLILKGNMLKNLKELLKLSIDDLNFRSFYFTPIYIYDHGKIIIEVMDKLHNEESCNVFFFAFEKNEELIKTIEEINKISSCKHYYVFKDSLINCSNKLKLFLLDYPKFLIEYRNIDNNKLVLNEDNFAFVLGAGCSIASNISNWGELCKSLGYELLTENENYGLSNYGLKNINDAILHELFNSHDKNTVLDIAKCKIREKSYANEMNYFKSIHNTLYLNYDDNKDYKTDLMLSISKCIKRVKMKEVITFNFDYILEKNMDNNYCSKSFEINNSVVEVEYDNNTLQIYHVHGYIPYDYDGITFVNNFTLTDNDFLNNIEADNYCNTIQKKTYSEKDVLFIGCSFNDINLRRILQSLKNGRSNKLYAITKVPEFENLKNKPKEKTIASIKYKYIIEEYYKKLNLIPIWVNDYKEIISIIDNIGN